MYAAGVQFPPVTVGGNTLSSSQANNVYIFPAIGMAIYATQARRVTDELFVVAARALADQVTDEQLAQGLLYPPQSNMLEVELAIASKVAEVILRARARSRGPALGRRRVHPLRTRTSPSMRNC